MSKNFIEPNLTEYQKFAESLAKRAALKMEWYFASISGWDHEIFRELYKKYVYSTKIVLGSGKSATIEKGDPLENLIRYFLEKGGVVKSIKEIAAPGRWQVDGQGLIEKSCLLFCWGEELCKKIGFQIYMEAKNHKEPVDNTEFARHFQRMIEHECNLGLLVSTAGFKIGRGQGIAESIHLNFWKDRFHLLLTFPSFKKVENESLAPLEILQEALSYAINDRYKNDREIQDFYSKGYSEMVIQEEYDRYYGSASI